MCGALTGGFNSIVRKCWRPWIHKDVRWQRLCGRFPLLPEVRAEAGGFWPGKCHQAGRGLIGAQLVNVGARLPGATGKIAKDLILI